MRAQICKPVVPCSPSMKIFGFMISLLLQTVTAFSGINLA
ncbi:hypothetical protein AOX55_00001178 [Sinorhizobium fredii CCBAU 25509]|nr:hypothetical protein AOX55_00001178 [Sinorhizobium fredii CCBAU 25509]